MCQCKTKRETTATDEKQECSIFLVFYPPTTTTGLHFSLSLSLFLCTHSDLPTTSSSSSSSLPPLLSFLRFFLIYLLFLYIYFFPPPWLIPFSSFILQTHSSLSTFHNLNSHKTFKTKKDNHHHLHCTNARAILRLPVFFFLDLT